MDTMCTIIVGKVSYHDAMDTMCTGWMFQVGQGTVCLDRDITLLGLEKGIGRVVLARSKAQSCGARQKPWFSVGAQLCNCDAVCTLAKACEVSLS